MATHERTALAVVDHPPAEIAVRRPVPGLIRPIARPDEMLKVQEDVRSMLAEILQEGRDYGKIAGCGDKPSMLKPGAERATMAFGCYSRFDIVEKEIDHDREVPWLKRRKKWANGREAGWEETRGTSLGLYRYVVECEIVHRESDTVVGSCIASCSTMESKYIDRPRDSENTVLKMAEKRAHVGAVLNAFGLSEQFTQDIEENPDLYRREGAAPAAEESGEAPPACPKCGGRMWDNRDRNDEKLARDPKAKLAPDWKCRDKGCGGLYWRGQWPPKSDISQLSDQVRAMVEELRALDEQAGAEAEVYAEEILQAPDLTEDEVKTLGGKLLARLNRAKGARAGAPGGPASDEPDESSSQGDPPPPPPVSAWGDDDDLPF